MSLHRLKRYPVPHIKVSRFLDRATKAPNVFPPLFCFPLSRSPQGGSTCCHPVSRSRWLQNELPPTPERSHLPGRARAGRAPINGTAATMPHPPKHGTPFSARIVCPTTHDRRRRRTCPSQPPPDNPPTHWRCSTPKRHPPNPFINAKCILLLLQVFPTVFEAKEAFD